tara:strand:+ start:64 stop:1509 length:1446 start_codon:yes stop_codon:yes gene_type:complete
MKSNIFFLSIDSLRQDKCLGKSKTSVTPNLDKLIQNGTFFNQIISTAPITVPSLSSLFTGLYPFECTTVDDTRGHKSNLYDLNQNLPTFSDDLIKSGYHTYAIIPELLKYTNISKLFTNVKFFNSFATLYDENLGNEILKTLNQDVKSPWFLFVHLVDLHGNAIFHLGDNFEKSEENYTGVNQYDKMLSAIDPWLGKIFQCINLKNTICVTTSDHGSTFADFTEEMLNFSLENDRLREFEPGFGFNSAHKIATNFPKKLTPLRKKLAKIYTKHRTDKVKKKLEPRLDLAENLDLSPYQKRLLKKSILYPCDCFDENFRPALILLGPDLPSGKIISAQTSSIDLFPTILDLIKIPTKINHRGKSLVPLFSNTKNGERVVMVDSASSESQAQYSNTIGLRSKQYKYFRDRLSESKNVHLYDLENDPLELSNISEQNPDIIENLEHKLSQINPTGNFAFKKTHELSEEDSEKIEKELRKLGYID